MRWWLVGFIRDQASIFVMGPNPNPYEILTICNGQCSVVNSYPDRPELANFFEMKRRVGRIDFKEFEILFRQLLNRFRQVLETPPKPFRGSMHLEILKLALGLFLNSFIDQEIQPA